MNLWIGKVEPEEEVEILADITHDAALSASPGQKGRSIIDPTQLMRSITGGEKMVILDIRPRSAFKNGHLPNAKSIPIDELGIRAEDELSRDSLIVLYAECSDCEGANETPRLQSKLISLGFTRVSRLQGGFDGWRQAGFEIVKE